VSGPTHRDGPLAFVDSLEHPELTDGDRHHLARVLRVRPGTEMVVCDGAGSWRRARFDETIDLVGPIEHEVPSTPALRIGFSLIKGDRPELIVQKLTELGIDGIVPFTSDHSVVHWEPKRQVRQHERFVTIAREASMQCRRTVLPEISPLTTFAELAAGSPPPVMAEFDGGPVADLIATPTAPTKPITVLIGPEGGWSEAERRSGLATVRIGRHILRAETAAIAAGILLDSLR